jgi:predicted aminopeptidase
MTHATLYRKGQGAFNEGLAMLVGRVGACLFAERMYGPSNPRTRKAGERIQDQRLFSAFLNDLLDELEGLYDSGESYQNKLRMREDIFQRHLQSFNRLRARLKTDTFSRFGEATWNNAYLLSIGLYHSNFRHFEAVLRYNGGDLKATIETCRAITQGEKDAMEAVMGWLMKHPSISSTRPAVSSLPRLTHRIERNTSIGPHGVLPRGAQNCLH